jgi:flagellar hook-basal body complex protein FliE
MSDQKKQPKEKAPAGFEDLLDRAFEDMEEQEKKAKKK